MLNVDSEVWEKEYKDTFFGDPKAHQMRQAAKRRIAPAEKGKEGSLNIQRKEAKPVPDMSEFFGRAGGAGKADQNKAALRDISGRKAAMTIGPDADGNISVTTDE